MNRKINILFFIDVFDGKGGTERHLSYLASGLDKNRFNCLVVPFRVNEAYLEFSTLDFRVIPMPIVRAYAPSVIWKAFKLIDIIKKHQIDIVQTYHFLSDTYGVVVSRLASVPYVISSRRDMGFKKGKLHLLIHRIVNRWVERFITVSDAVGDRITEKENVPRERQVTIRNGTDLSQFSLPTPDEIRDARSTLGFRETDFVVGIVGHMRQEKGHAMFFQAACSLSELIPNVKFVAVGLGPLHDFYRAFVKERGLDDRVVFTGYVQDAKPFIRAFDVACLTSNTEGFSNAILEYMAFGKPVVATAVGGNREVVEEGITGYLVPPESPGDLVERVVALHDDARLRERMGRACRKAVEEKFSLERMIEAHSALYEEIMNGTGGHRPHRGEKPHLPENTERASRAG